MHNISLTREQISKLISIYDHFRDIQNFTVRLEDDGKVYVSFDILEISPKEDKNFIPKILHR